MASNLDRLQALKALYLQLLLQVQLALATPTPANIDAAVAAVNNATATNPLVPRLQYSLDGESYDWAGYQSMILDQIPKLNALIQAESLPWCIVSRARP